MMKPFCLCKPWDSDYSDHGIQTSGPTLQIPPGSLKSQHLLNSSNVSLLNISHVSLPSPRGGSQHLFFSKSFKYCRRPSATHCSRQLPLSVHAEQLQKSSPGAAQALRGVLGGTSSATSTSCSPPLFESRGSGLQGAGLKVPMIQTRLATPLITHRKAFLHQFLQTLLLTQTASMSSSKQQPVDIDTFPLQPDYSVT